MSSLCIIREGGNCSAVGSPWVPRQPLLFFGFFFFSFLNPVHTSVKESWFFHLPTTPQTVLSFVANLTSKCLFSGREVVYVELMEHSDVFEKNVKQLSQVPYFLENCGAFWPQFSLLTTPSTISTHFLSHFHFLLP